MERIQGLYQALDTKNPAIPGGNVPPTKVGQTAHFTIFKYDQSDAELAPALNSLLATAELSIGRLSGWFPSVATPANFNVYLVTSPIFQGAMHYGCSGTELYVDCQSSLPTTYSPWCTFAEVVEVYAAVQNGGWKCSNSSGEGLSRVLASELYPGAEPFTYVGGTPGFVTSNVYLDSNNSSRPDYVAKAYGGDGSPVANGCAVLFLNWLRYQLGFDWGAIIGAGAANLAQTFQTLTGIPAGEALNSFGGHLAIAFPPGNPCGLQTDNPFPLALPKSIKAAFTPSYIPLDASVSMLFRARDAASLKPVPGAAVMLNGVEVGTTGAAFTHTFTSQKKPTMVVGVDGRPHRVMMPGPPTIDCEIEMAGYPNCHIDLFPPSY
jgi:hypothetical protein